MSVWKVKQEWMQKTVVVWFGALLCCLLWGSAFPCIKIGYRLFEVDAADTASQILFAGCRFTLAGEGAIFFSTIAYAFSSVFVKKFSQKFNPVMLSAYQFIIGGIVLMAAGGVMGGHITKVTPSGIGLLVYLALVSAVAYSLWGILLKYNPVSRVTVFGFMNPVFGVLLSALLLGETDQASGILGLLSLLLVSVGIYVVNSGK